MSDSSDRPEANRPPPSGETAGEGPVVYNSVELFQGRREVWIEHGMDMYRLRLTAANKLYLTK